MSEIGEKKAKWVVALNRVYARERETLMTVQRLGGTGPLVDEVGEELDALKEIIEFLPSARSMCRCREGRVYCHDGGGEYSEECDDCRGKGYLE